MAALDQVVRSILGDREVMGKAAAILADANAWILFTGSSASTTVVTSTGMKVGSTPEYHYVIPGSRYTVLST